MSSTGFDARAKGIYARYVPKARGDGDSLAKLLNPQNALTISKSGPWGAGNFTTRFHRHGSREEASFNLFGQVLGPEHGTGMGALGGTSRPGQILEDDTPVRDLIVLGLPTNAIKELETLYNAQVTALNAISVMDLGFADGQKRDWVKPISIDGEQQSITVALSRKYHTFDDHPVKRRKTDEDMDISDTHKHKFGGRPDPHSITLSSSYSPRVLYDFDPEVEKFKTAKLMQQPLYDLRNKLVPPWEAQETFREGTLVQVKAHLNVHHFPPFDANHQPYNTYQIVTVRTRVVAESPIPFDHSIFTHTDIFDEISEIVDEADEHEGSPASVGEAFAEDPGNASTGSKHPMKRRHQK